MEENMNQTIKIKVVTNNTKKGVWITLPTTQKDLEQLLNAPKIHSWKIQSSCCNTLALHNAITQCRDLSKINYLAELFSQFDKSKRVQFGALCEFFLCDELNIDLFLNLAMNIAKDTKEYQKFKLTVPERLNLKIGDE